MKQLILITITTLSVNGAIASPLIDSLQSNVYTAQATLRQEAKRFERAKTSYQTSKERLKQAQKRLSVAKQDELKEDRQIRAIAKANAEYYEIPQYNYQAGNTNLKWSR